MNRHWDEPRSNYNSLTLETRARVDAAVAALYAELLKSGVDVQRTPHIQDVAETVSKWVLETCTFEKTSPIEDQQRFPAKLDVVYQNMSWWQLGFHDPNVYVQGSYVAFDNSKTYESE